MKFLRIIILSSGIFLQAIVVYGQVKYYTMPHDAVFMANAAYRPLQSTQYYGDDFFYVVESASDDVTNKIDSEPLDTYIWNTTVVSKDSNRFANLWTISYKGIMRANLAIDKIPSIKSDPVLQRRLIAEAKFLRALYYFNFVNLFGDVPLWIKFPNDSSDIFKPRSAEANVYQQIISDLKDAENDLPLSYPPIENWRATKGAAKALLGKAYLYNQQWPEAASKFKEIIDLAIYSLVPDFKDNFKHTTEHNAESIFELEASSIQGGNGFTVWEGNNSGEGTQRDLLMGIQNTAYQEGYGELIATQDWVLSCELGDPRIRASVWFPFDSTLTGYEYGLYDTHDLTNNKYNGILTYTTDMNKSAKAVGNILGEFYHIKKNVDGYAGPNGVVNSWNNYRLIRYADVLLMYAEALNEANNGPTAEAINALNLVRARAKGNNIFGYSNEMVQHPSTVSGILPAFPCNVQVSDGNTIDLTTSNKDNFRIAIVRERRAELAFEYHRFFDLKRWQKVSATHPGAAGTILTPLGFDVSKNLKYPVPLFGQWSPTLYKGNLQQNPGY